VHHHRYLDASQGRLLNRLRAGAGAGGRLAVWLAARRHAAGCRLSGAAGSKPATLRMCTCRAMWYGVPFPLRFPPRPGGGGGFRVRVNPKPDLAAGARGRAGAPARARCPP
jgi:hypothetical protein